MLDALYFFIFHHVRSFRLRFNLMGMIAFLKSGIKHARRGNWGVVKDQADGFFMCLKAIFSRKPVND